MGSGGEGEGEVEDEISKMVDVQLSGRCPRRWQCSGRTVKGKSALGGWVETEWCCMEERRREVPQP